MKPPPNVSEVGSDASDRLCWLDLQNLLFRDGPVDEDECFALSKSRVSTDIAGNWKKKA